MKNTQTPDPYNFFYRKRTLEVNSYDIYAKLLPELSGKKSSVAGDGYNLEKRDALGIWETDKFKIDITKDAEILVIDVPMN